MSGAGTSIPGPVEPHGGSEPAGSNRTTGPGCEVGGAYEQEVGFLTDESLLGELDGEPPGDFLQLSVLETQIGPEEVLNGSGSDEPVQNPD